MPTLKLPDGSAREVAAGARPRDVAESIGKRLAQAAPARTLDVENQVCVIANRSRRPDGCVEGSQKRGLVLSRVVKAIRALVCRVEGKSALKDDVGLAGKPVAVVLGVRCHGDNRGILGHIGGRGLEWLLGDCKANGRC